MAESVAYAERRSTRLPATVWIGSSTPGTRRILPDGCMDLIWDGTRILVAGPDTTAFESRSDGWAQLVAVRFDPGIAPTLLGVPASALTDTRVDLADVWTGRRVARWADALDAADDPAAELERLAAERLRREEPPPAWVGPVVELLGNGERVDEVADRVGYTSRHLGRLAGERFGYGPKVLARILRMCRARDLLGAGCDLSTAAATAGYADYSHLFREFHALTGRPPASFQPAEGSAA